MLRSTSWSRPPAGLRLLSLLAAVVLIGTSAPGSAAAQGFGVYEQGTCVMARAGAAVAQGCDDGSSIYFNPAHIAGAQGTTVSLGATLIDANGDFTYDSVAEAPGGVREVELQNDPVPVPHGYVTYGLNDRSGIGLGLYVPFGLETVWPQEVADGRTFDGAFEGYDNRVQSIYVQPTIGYQVTPRLRVGGGPILAVSTVELNQLVDLSQTPTVEGGPRFGELGVPFHTAFAQAKLEGSNELGFGANIGASYRISDRFTLGARFTTPIKVEYSGDASFEQIDTNLTVPADLTQGGQVLLPAGTPLDAALAPQFSEEGRLSEQGVETEITFPFQLVAGVSVQATERLLLLADYQLTGWSAFDEIPIDFEKATDTVREENYDNTHAVRLGAEYDVLDPLTARIGYLYNTAAAPDAVVTPLLPENDRNQFTLGVGWRPVETLEVNVSYHLLQQNSRRGRVRSELPGEPISTDLNQGLYEFGANLFGTTLTLYL